MGSAWVVALESFGACWDILIQPFYFYPHHTFLSFVPLICLNSRGLNSFFLPCNMPREFLPGFSESLLVGIMLLVPPPLMSWEIWTERGAQEDRGVGKVIQKVDARSLPSLPCHRNWAAHGQSVSTDSFVAFQASIRLPKKVETVSFPPSQEQTGVCRRDSLSQSSMLGFTSVCLGLLLVQARCGLGSPGPRATR